MSLVLAGSMVAGAASALADIDGTRCVIEPATSTGTQSGGTAVAVGERLNLGTELDLPAGPAYQDILANPDGSTYVASWIGVAPAGTLDADLSSLMFTIDGVRQPLTTGTEPRPDGFVLDTSQSMLKVLFPGDPAVMEDPSGSGSVSFVVPEGGQTLRLAYAATVPDVAAGEVIPAVSCQAALSDGESNVAVDERDASVAVLGLDVEVAKSSDLPGLAPSTTVTYTIVVSVPAFDESGEVRNGSAFDTVVTDVLPAGLDYVAGSASQGGVLSDGALTWRVAELGAGSSVTLSYQMTVPADAAPGATYTNEASAVTTSQPGAVSDEATSESDVDRVTLTNGAEAPAIDKSSSVAVAGQNQVVTYEVDFTWPAGSTWHDVTITDLLPDGITLVNAGSFACSPGACPAMTAIAAFTDTGGNTRFGYYIEELGPFTVDQSWTWTYTARMIGSFAGGAAVPIGTELGNLAEARFNLIARRGGVVPNPARLGDYDGVVGDTAPVTFDRPVISIDKAAPEPSEIDLAPDGITYTVTLSNSGGVDATGVRFTDPGPSSSGYELGTIDAASVTGATFAAGTFTVSLIPAGESRQVTYTVIGSGDDLVAVRAAYDNTATVTGYGDPAGNSYTSSMTDEATVAVAQPSVSIDKQRVSASPIAGTDGEPITYRVTVTNDGDATAYNISGSDELDFTGAFVPGTCAGGLSFSADGDLSLAELPPGAVASCEYQVELDGDQPEGSLTNTVTVTWRNGFGQTGEWSPEEGVQPWTTMDDATTTVVHPQLALQKRPEADTPGNFIVNGKTATYTVSVANVGAVAARNVELTDALPAGLTLEAPPTLTSTPAGIVHSISGAAGDSSFTITVPALGTGELLQISIPVRHDGVEPADDQIVNTATLTADGIDAPLTDTGVLQWMPDVNLPVADKSVNPTSAGIGEQVTWTVTATVPVNTVNVFDLGFVDTVPRGMVFDSYETASCSGPLCATVPDPTALTAAVLSTGETRLGWFVGDVPPSTGETTYTFTFTASIASEYTGTGSPPAGTQVTDALLVNLIQPWFTLTPARDTYNDGSLPDLAEPLASQFERRAAASFAFVRAATPRVIADKEVTNLGGPFVWETEEASGTGWMGDPGDQISYEVTFTNVGSTIAHDIEIRDSMGQPASGATMLRDVQITGLPAGVTVLDGWTLEDPEVIFHIDQLAPDATVTIAYTGVVAPSEELVPGFSGDNRDIALIRNAVAVTEFFSSPGGGGLSFEDTFATGGEIYVYTPSPYLTGGACIGGFDSPAGTTATFVANTKNGAPPFGEVSGTLLTTGYPPDPTVGVGHDATLTIVLSPNMRYVPGTTTVSGVASPDPTTSIDAATSVQTLVFDLGDYAQNEAHGVVFDVRTTAFGVSGGMRATLTMDDASGSPSRGTATAGAAYVYQHAISRGCAPAQPLAISKVPDLDSRYEGKKQFKVGEDVRWFGGVVGGGAPYHDGEFIDLMPAGIDYTPGSAVFIVRMMDFTTVVASAANGTLTEEVTALPDGRTQLRFTSPAFAEFRSISYTIDSVVAEDALIGATLTNVIDLVVSDGIDGNCTEPAAAVCDNGQVRIVSAADPTVIKSVDHTVGPWGDTFSYTVEVTLPGNLAYFDAFIGDRGAYPRELAAAEPYAATAITCLSGCDIDPAPATLPAFRDTDEFARAWYLGDLASQIDARIYRMTYRQTFLDANEYETEFGVEPTSQQFVNQAVTGWSDTNVLDDASYQPGGAAHTAASSRTFAIMSDSRGLDDAAVNLAVPELTVTKQCQALNGRDDPAASTSIGGETTGSVPNFRCVLTATNTTDPVLGTTVIDPVMVDTVPTTSVGGRSMTSQLISSTSEEPLVNVEATEVPGTTLDPPAVSSLRITAAGLDLAPGESVSVTVDLRVTADPSFWNNDALETERGTNSLAAQSFSDLAGNSYSGISSDAWDLDIQKPRLTVSERAWVGDGYEASLADGRPTACMAYAFKPDPLLNSRVLGSGTWNLCSRLKDARLHETTPGGEYGRAYGGGAPDVVFGVDDRVTWAVDTAVINADEFATVAITDQIPYGFEYVPGTARLAHWSETGTSHTPLADPVIGATPAVTCSSTDNFYNGRVVGELVMTGVEEGQAPWTPLTWTFAMGAAGAAGAFWDDGLAYLHDANRDAAGALEAGTPFDRMVRLVFDVRPRAEFGACLQTPQRANSFRSKVTATGTHSSGSASSSSLGWVVGVELARLDKSPDGRVSADGTTVLYDIDVTITDPTRLRNANESATPATNTIPTPSFFCVEPPLPASPTRTPWIGLGDLDRNGTPLTATYTGTWYGSDFRSELVVTDTLVDDGLYVPGSASFEMFDPWGRSFVGHLASEEVERITVDGREASRVTWTFDYYPSPLNIGRAVGVFPCPVSRKVYVTYPSSMRISVPLAIPDGTLDGTTYPNTAQVRSSHISGGEVVRTQAGGDDALVIVRNPLPPPPATKRAMPDEVAPGDIFQWMLEADFVADSPWLDLGWVDEIPASMDFLGYGTPACVVTGTATPCADPPLPTPLTPVANADGSTTIGWFVGDVLGSSQQRTLRLPITVRFVGDQVAGDELTNLVTGFSNEDDEVGTLTSPPDPSDFTYLREAVGVATVVEPALEISKQVTNGPGPFQAGDTVTYDLTVTNTGAATAYDVPVSDVPDPALQNATTTSPFRSKGWTSRDPRLEWFLPTIAPGQTVILDVSGVVAIDYLQSGIRTLTNTATIAPYTSRPVSDEQGREYPAEQATATVPLVAPNLTVAKHAGAGCTELAQAFAPGEPVAWCVVVANTGDAPAHNVTLTDLLPLGWTYEAGSARVDDIATEPALSTTSSGGQRLVWTLGQVESATDRVIIYRTIGADGDNLVTNTAIANSTLEDGSPVPNSPPGFRSTAQARAAALGAGLQMAKLPDGQRLECDRLDGCTITWQIVVVNADDADLTDATVTDYLPAGLTPDSVVDASGWNAAVVGAPGSGPSSTTPITWTHPGTFSSGDVAAFEITAIVPADSQERAYLNHATAGAASVPQVSNQALAQAYATASLGSLVWHDLDADGRQDPAEPGIAGVAVQLYRPSDTLLGSARGAGLLAALNPADTGTLVDSTVTDVDGHYLFVDLEPGSYRIRFLMPDGWVTTSANVGSDDADSDPAADGWTQQIALASGTDDLTLDAGLYPMPSPSMAQTGLDIRGLALPGLVSLAMGWLLLRLGAIRRRRYRRAAVHSSRRGIGSRRHIRSRVRAGDVDGRIVTALARSGDGA